uniref:Uncharacterized protein n=1 Tax=Rhizophora mucronata TaxID=61149 RepID=A0A2P2IXT0_RHIMU
MASNLLFNTLATLNSAPIPSSLAEPPVKRNSGVAAPDHCDNQTRKIYQHFSRFLLCCTRRISRSSVVPPHARAQPTTHVFCANLT